MQNKQETAFASPFGNVELRRYPKEKDPTLRAWSAADEYLLQYFADTLAPGYAHCPKLLIANDTFGALSICLREFSPVLWSDSFICQQALAKNINLNKTIITENQRIQFLASTDSLPETLDAALMQLPKNHAYLRFQLEHIKQKLSPHGIVVAGVMVKHFHPNVLQHFEKIIGPTSTTLARKKARLIIAKNDAAIPTTPKTLESYASRYPLESPSCELLTLPNVFSYEKLDIGTRALLPYLPRNPLLESILDLGCGNGALGIQAAINNPQADIHFVDESYLAIASAKLSAAQNQLKNPTHFLVTDTLKNAPKNLDLILCNPPFHQQNSMHTEIAQRMFQQAFHHLKSGGELLVVANRHLPYQQKLRKYFPVVTQVGQTKKFVILRATR